MRTADEGRSPDSGSEAELGDGYKVTAADLTGGFGDDIDDGFGDDAYPSDEGDDGADDTDASFEEPGLDDESIAEMSESEAEDALVDLIEQEGYSADEAEGIVDDLQRDTGLSAGELLEDYVDEEEDHPGEDPLGMDGGLGAGPGPVAEAFDPLDLPSDSDLDLNHDGKISPADAHIAHDAFDFDLGG